jgi:hypothetical protein
MSDPIELLRAANPVPACPAPAIERLWDRLGTDPEGRPSRAPRGAWLSRLVATGAVALALAVGAVAVLALHPARPAAPRVAGAGALPSPARGVIGILGVLRRPASAADRLRGARLRSIERLVAGTPRVARARLATVTPWGAKVFLVPVGPPTASSIARLPKLLRGSAPLRQRLASWHGGLRLMVLASGLACCATARAIEGGGDWSTGGSGSLNWVVLVVPDGVARVTVPLPGGTVAAGVQGNVAAFEVPRGVENLSAYPMTWYGSSGAILRRFAGAPPVASPARALRRTRSSLRESGATAVDCGRTGSGHGTACVVASRRPSR